MVQRWNGWSHHWQDVESSRLLEFSGSALSVSEYLPPWGSLRLVMALSLPHSPGALLPALGKNDALERMAWQKERFSAP